MATKNIKKGKDTTRTTAADPFAAVAEPSDGETSKRPKRATKNAKVPKVAAAKAADTPRARNTVAKKSRVAAKDAFAEIAAATDEEVTLEIPAVPARKRSAAAKKIASTESRAEPVKDPNKPIRTKRKAQIKDTTASSSAVPTTAVTDAEAPPQSTDETKAIATTEPKVELSPLFKALADVKLPELPRENRARLQMQSPTRLYFYWSLRQNPWQQLRAVFGPELGSYTLVVKLRNLTDGTEEIHPIETQGEWWFNDAEPDTEYMAEIGFYATNRPYFRVLYSNTVTTPRRSPSTHPATEARWTVSATKFAEVLDASGFTRDAVDVAIAGDDHLDAAEKTNLAFADLMTGAEYSTRGIVAEDMRHAILALAGGARLENLRHRVSPSLFNVLQANADRLSTSGARKALTEHFEIDEAEWTEHEFGPAVFGASLVNFPKTLRSRKDTTYSPRYNPVSSFSLDR
jgi:hypothetical protein